MWAWHVHVVFVYGSVMKFFACRCVGYGVEGLC